MDENMDIEASEHIKDLFLHLNPMINIAGSSENTLEMLLYLSEVDPNFHKLELVKGIRKAIRESLTAKVENCVGTYLEEHEGKIREENIVDYLADKLFQDETFVNLKSKLQSLFTETVDNLKLQAEESSFKDVVMDEDEYFLNKVSPVSSNETSLNSSLNQSGFLFLNPAQYNNIAESLKKRHLQENLHNSLHLLLTVTPGEPVTQVLWPSICKSLREFLQSEDDELFGKSLKFHTRLLSSQVHVAVKEGFLNIVEALSGFWLSKKLIQRVLYKSSMIPVEENKVLILMKILVKFLKEFSSMWIRYPSQYISDMIDGLFSVFGIHVSPKKEERMSFLDLVSFLDPKAMWFQSWTHGQLGRKKTFSALKNKSSLLSCSLSYCLTYLEEKHDPITKVPNDAVPLQLFECLKFNHSLSILFCIIKYSEGRQLFPIYDHLKKDHFTLKNIFNIFTNSVKPLKQNLTSKIILSKFSNFCHSKENLCKLVCELGTVDSLIQILEFQHLNGATELKSWYFQLALEFFISVNSTAVGHEYILIGKLSKTLSKVHLTTNIQTPAQKIFNFTKVLITCRHSLSTEVIKTSVRLTCMLLQSPLGRHLFLNHSLIGDLIVYLQAEFKVTEIDFTLMQIRNSNLQTHFEEHFEYVIEKLLVSHKGLILLDRNNVLVPVLSLVLPQFAMNGKITPKLLNRIVCSEQGCIALGQNLIVKPFWQLLEHIMMSETLSQPPFLYEELSEALEEALIPILCIASTFEGMKLLYSKAGLLDELTTFLLDPKEQETDHYSLALKILGTSTSNLDGLLFLEMLFNLQETLLMQQNERMSEGGVIVDENSVMRSFILASSFMPRGNTKFDVHPFVVEDQLPAKMNIVHSLPLVSKEKVDKCVKGTSVKKQSELWRFLNDTRTGLHDTTWLSHCRRAYRVELSTNEEIKMPVLTEALELCLDTLGAVADERLCGVAPVVVDEVEDIPSPISTSFSNNVFCYPLLTPQDHEDDGGASTCPTPGGGGERGIRDNPVDAPKTEPNFDAFTPAHSLPNPPSSLGIEMMIRYGSQLNLIPDNASQRSNLLKLKIATDAHLLHQKRQRFDWFSVLFYYLTGGNVDKTFSLLRKVRALKVGAVVWPSLGRGLSASPLRLAPSEFLFSAVIHCTKLVLFRDCPVAFLALEDVGGGIVWNLLSEWMSESFVGVLPWPENLHMTLFPLLHGGDYHIYSLVCLLLHVHRNLIERTSQTQFKKIVYLQTEVIENWRIQEHFSYMDSLSKRFRRIVTETLTQTLELANAKN